MITLLCAVIILADYFGIKQLDGFWYFMCWVGMFGYGLCTTIIKELKS